MSGAIVREALWRVTVWGAQLRTDRLRRRATTGEGDRSGVAPRPCVPGGAGRRDLRDRPGRPGDRRRCPTVALLIVRERCSAPGSSGARAAGPGERCRARSPSVSCPAGSSPTPPWCWWAARCCSRPASSPTSSASSSSCRSPGRSPGGCSRASSRAGPRSRSPGSGRPAARATHGFRPPAGTGPVVQGEVVRDEPETPPDDEGPSRITGGK